MQVLSALQKADLKLFAWLFRSGERYLLIQSARAVSRSGDGYVHLLLPLILLATGTEDAVTFLAVLALGLSAERPAYWILKNALKRRRPQDFVPGLRSFIVASDRFSFPSGHSSAAFLLAVSLCLIYGPAGYPMLAWAVCVALSRVILGVHFPGDVVAGACMGSAIAFAADALPGALLI